MHAQCLTNADTLKSQQQIFQGLLFAFSCLILRAYGCMCKISQVHYFDHCKHVQATISCCPKGFSVKGNNQRGSQEMKGVGVLDKIIW